MDILLIALLIAILLALVVVLMQLKKLSSDASNTPMIELLGQMNVRLDGSKEYIAKLANALGAMQIIGKNIDDLRSVFMNSKLRGNFGEQVLNDMLTTNFPKEQFELQHKFKDGQTVDAIIKTKDGVIPIDSKFPIDNYRKMHAAESDELRAVERKEFGSAVKKHVNDIAKKYILPAEGTTNFAVMYIPSEAIYYEIISVSDELSEYAKQLRVLMVSPNTLSYFLHILRLGHERIRIEENVQKVWEMLAGFQQETMKFGEQLGIVGRHITNAKSAMDTAHGAYDRLASKIDQIRHLK